LSAAPGRPVALRRRADSDDLSGWLAGRWGGTRIAVHGEVYDAARLPAFLAWHGHSLVGVLTYAPAGEVLEIVTCDADPPGQGVGRQLVAAVVAEARALGAASVRCTTTNDNLPALGFWQAVGFHLVALRPDAVRLARRLKPQIPATGWRGLPVRDEIDLELTPPG
jgi:GNAT superfamily N-acetyltransferase